MSIYLLYRLFVLSTFMLLLFRFRYGKGKTFASTGIVMAIIWVINVLIYNATDIDFWNSIYPFTVSLPAFLCFAAVSQNNIFKTLFSFLTVCNFGMLTSCMGLLLFSFTNSFAVRVIAEMITVLVILLLIIYTRQSYFKVLNKLDKGWPLLCSFPLLLSGIIYLLMYYPNEFYNRLYTVPVLGLVFGLMFLFYIIVYSSFENISEIYQFKHDRDVILLQSDMQKKEYAAIAEQINAIKIYKHDMRHHLSIINTFLLNSNVSEALSYLNKLNDKLSSTTIEQYCENYMLNVILSTYIKKARNEGIKVTVKASIPETLYIDNLELGLIFTNAIENAINACAEIADETMKKIDIICKEQYDQIYIQISNPYTGDIVFNGDFPVSTSKEHGIGTKSIAAIADKYEGVYSFTAKDGIFKTTVIIKNAG